jgi:hypothetical protein
MYINLLPHCSRISTIQQLEVFRLSFNVPSCSPLLLSVFAYYRSRELYTEVAHEEKVLCVKTVKAVA